MSKVSVWIDKRGGQHPTRAAKELANAQYDQSDAVSRIQRFGQEEILKEKSVGWFLIKRLVGAFTEAKLEHNRLLEQQNSLLKERIKQERFLELQKTDAGKKQLYAEWREELDKCRSSLDFEQCKPPFWISQEDRDSYESILIRVREKEEEQSIAFINEQLLVEKRKRKKKAIVAAFLLFGFFMTFACALPGLFFDMPSLFKVGVFFSFFTGLPAVILMFFGFFDENK